MYYSITCITCIIIHICQNVEVRLGSSWNLEYGNAMLQMLSSNWSIKRFNAFISETDHNRSVNEHPVPIIKMDYIYVVKMLAKLVGKCFKMFFYSKKTVL